jgi:hypothetical protein
MSLILHQHQHAHNDAVHRSSRIFGNVYPGVGNGIGLFKWL